ncbi:MAG: hypothetical protein WBQ25_24865 [Nitrososphaeraceae archaeon]
MNSKVRAHGLYLSGNDLSIFNVINGLHTINVITVNNRGSYLLVKVREVLNLNIPPTFRAGLDKFGIKKIYSTRPGGEEWYMTNNPNNDPRFQLGSIDLIRNEDDSFKVTSTEVRLGVYTSSGYDQNQIATLDQESSKRIYAEP